MIETEFKALMHRGMFVDTNLLAKGIYTCDKPFIYSKNETIESMVERGKQMKDMTGESFISDKYFENLQQCELVKIFVTNEKLTDLLKTAYRWGRDYGSNQSEKNFNDLLQTEAVKRALGKWQENER